MRICAQTWHTWQGPKTLPHGFSSWPVWCVFICLCHKWSYISCWSKEKHNPSSFPKIKYIQRHMWKEKKAMEGLLWENSVPVTVKTQPVLLLALPLLSQQHHCVLWWMQSFIPHDCRIGAGIQDRDAELLTVTWTNVRLAHHRKPLSIELVHNYSWVPPWCLPCMASSTFSILDR